MKLIYGLPAALAGGKSKMWFFLAESEEQAAWLAQQRAGRNPEVQAVGAPIMQFAPGARTAEMRG